MKISIFVILIPFLFACNTSESKTEGDRYSGYLEVPENRQNSNGKTIKLAYVVLKAENSESKKAPILYLQGGPGGATLVMEPFWENNPLRYDHDIVLMDQRGTGQSEAMCDFLGNDLISVLAQDLTPEEEFELSLKGVLECKSQIEKQGIDVTAYNSKENAADFEDLRIELGYKKWNIIGGSYGSRLGLTYMRDFPNGVRASILAGLFPPEVDMYTNLISNFKQSLYRVFETCENDEDCNKRYPEIKDQFLNAMSQVQEKPLVFSFRGEPFTMNVQDMLLMMHQMLYNRQTIADIPAFISAVQNKNESVLQRALQPAVAVSGLINMAMYMSVNANDELPFSGTEEFIQDLKNNPELPVAPAFFASDTELLKKWHGSRSAAIENEAVVSDIPTFLVNGYFDPVTPTSNAVLTAKSLKNSYLTEFKKDGHSVFNPCFFSMCKQFLDNPEQQPDFSCVQKERPINWN